MTRRPAGSGLFSYTTLPYTTPFPFTRVAPDVVHLHWIAQGFDYGSLFASLPASMPVVWTLHDMEPFTGGCHHAGACARFRSRCGSCPQLNALRNPWDLSALTFARKRRWYARPRLHVVGVSAAMAEEASRSPLFARAHGVSVIPNVIDTMRFAPRDRNAARHRLEIPLDRPVVAFGAVEPCSPYKGFSVLLDAIARIDRARRPLLLVFGGEVPPGTVPRDIAWTHAGFVSEPARLSDLYSAADVVAAPSYAESFGQVPAEALACGTPVVGTRVGGIPDFVIEGRTGLLAAAGDAADLAARLAWLLDRPEERRRLGANGTTLARERFSPEAVGQRYVALYESLVSV
jgi:glycosyltransferase involved in cell wall biosynthesis